MLIWLKLKDLGCKLVFDHHHHKKIHLLLNSLNADIFKEVGAYFGGGTLIALLNNEHRWSKDVDFICPIGTGYRRLRKIVANASFKPQIFFSDTNHLELPRDLKADQYGIRFLVVADQTPIKFEIVAEARISLNPPDYHPWSPRQSTLPPSKHLKLPVPRQVFPSLQPSHCAFPLQDLRLEDR